MRPGKLCETGASRHVTLGYSEESKADSERNQPAMPENQNRVEDNARGKTRERKIRQNRMNTLQKGKANNEHETVMRRRATNEGRFALLDLLRFSFASQAMRHMLLLT